MSIIDQIKELNGSNKSYLYKNRINALEKQYLTYLTKGCSK